MSRPREFDSSAALDRAVDTFWARGYDGTAVQDLCSAMDLNPGSLYGAFGDKRALFLAALDRY
ncbi:MAG TPA: helix-turn-helix domain-containing protein, partial [Burkholderiales bacterium]|nr:helix-turn-helix domain-containing protein [Burkholderiales bacterium]